METATATPVAEPTPTKDPDLLTNSCISTFAECPRKFQWKYVYRIRPAEEKDYFRFGRAYHLGLEVLGKTGSLDEAVQAVRDEYAVVPDWAARSDESIHKWLVEGETVVRLLCGWHWRWSNDPVEVIKTEEVFSLPILNPDTGRPARTHRRGGKKDQLIRHEGVLKLREFKTTGDAIDPDADYWKHLRIDAQISNYYTAYQDEGVDVRDVMYDVVRKPSIAPKQIPLRDEDGFKVVLDEHGNRVFNDNGKPRQSGDTKKGYVLQSRIETPEEFGARLTADIAERPDFYYARKSVPRLESDIEEFRRDMWQKHDAISHAKRTGFFPRNSRACMLMGKCEYFDLCSNGVRPDTLEPGEIPHGFKQSDVTHPEL